MHVIQHEAAKKKLHAKKQYVGQSGQLLESIGASELDRLSRAMTVWHCGHQLREKKLFTRSKLRCTRRVVRQYEKMASSQLTVSDPLMTRPGSSEFGISTWSDIYLPTLVSTLS